MEEAILVDLGGTLMLPEPRLRDYVEQGGLSDADSCAIWDYIVDGVKTGAVIPMQMPGVHDAVRKLSGRYVLSCFADSRDEFTRLCLDRLPEINAYFPNELVIPRDLLGVFDKSDPESWINASDYLAGKGYRVVACVDDELKAVMASQISEIGISSYFVDPNCARPNSYKLDHEGLEVRYVQVRDLSQMADHFLSRGVS